MFIDGDFFENLCDKKYPCDINTIITGDLVYVPTHLVIDFFNEISKTDIKIKLLTHNSDATIYRENDLIKMTVGLTFNKTDDIIDIPNNIIKWFGQNLNVENDNFFVSIPIGLERVRWSNGEKHKLLANLINHRVEKTYLVYVNHKERNNPDRISLRKFQNKSWCLYRNDRVDFNTYCDDILRSHFVISPIGNGLDCHRTWESLYLGSIPIVERNNCSEAILKELPALIVDSFDDVNEDMLNDFLSKNHFDLKKIKQEYYNGIIRES